MPTLATTKIVYTMLESAVQEAEKQTQLIKLVNAMTPDPAMLQDADNKVWKGRPQRATILKGRDLTGQEQPIIKEGYRCDLGQYSSDFVKQNIDDLRNPAYWQGRGRASGAQQMTDLNSEIAQAITLQGSKFFRSNTTTGFNFLSEAQVILNETQQIKGERHFILTDRTNNKFGQELAGRQTVQGRPDQVWQTGQIGSNIAEQDVHTGSYLLNLQGGASPNTTVTATVSQKPEAGTVVGGEVTNVDYRLGTIPVTSTAGYNVGDKIQFNNGANPVESLAYDSKNSTGQPMTFTVRAIPNATTLEVYPKPIAFDDASLNATEKYYANIDTQIANNAVVERLNIDASAPANLFFHRDAIEVMRGDMPANLFSEFEGSKVVQETMSNGLKMYVIYDGNIADLSFRYRLFCIWGITVCNPQNCGVAISI